MKIKKALLVGLPVLTATAAIILCACVFFASPGPFSGKVTDAVTGSPLTDICVTDGKNVVKTDHNGEFTLKGWRKSRFVSVTTPAGYTCRNYYIPVSKDTPKYDFLLTPDDRTKADTHSFIQISDTEVNEKGVGNWIDTLRDSVQETQPAFLIHTGDICYTDGLKRHIKDMNTENMGLPVYYTIGNHDYVDGKYGEALYESIYGPTWYSFDVGNVHYVVTPIHNGDYKSGYSKNDHWRWLENDLANTDPDKKVVIFNHTISPDDDYVIRFDRRELDLKAHNLIAWVYGHYHYNHIDENNGVLNISTARPECGGIDSSVSGWRTVSINEDGDIATHMNYYDFDSPSKTTAPMQWQTQLDGRALFCDTLLKDGRVYVGTVDDDYPRSCGVFCLSETDGSMLWFFQTKNSVKNNLVTSDNKIIAQDSEGNVYCLDSESGALVWETKVSLGSYALNTSSGICAEDGTVYTGFAGGVTALNIEDGKTIWNYDRGKGEGSPAEFMISGDRLILSSHWDALIALDKTSGKLLWENAESPIRFRSSTPAAVDENTLLVADDSYIMLVDAATGKITGKIETKGITLSSSARPVITDNVAYICTANKGILAFDLKTKKILWNTLTGSALVYTPPYVTDPGAVVEATMKEAGDTLIFGASDGTVYTLQKSDGTILKQSFVGAPMLGAAVLDGDTVIVSDFAGRVTRLAK